MGRRRRQPASNSDRQDNNAQLEELFVELWDLCDFFGTSESHKARGELSTKLHHLSRLLLGDKTDNETAQHEAIHQMMDLEDLVVEVRDRCNQYLCDIAEEVCIAADVMNSITEAVQREEHLIPKLIVYQSLLNAHRTQCSLERRSIDALLQSLDQLYSKTSFVQVAIDKTCQSLERQELLQQPHLRNAFDLLQKEMSTGVVFDSVRPLDRMSVESHNGKPIPAGDRGVVSLETAPTVRLALEQFLAPKLDGCYEGSVTFLLAVGPEGSGKTHLCDDMVRIASKGEATTVIRPRLPVEILGETVGETEDRILALFSTCLDTSKDVILILDNIESLVPTDTALEGGKVSSHSIHRSHLAMLTMFDTIRIAATDKTRVFVLCTSARDVGTAVARFDRVHYLDAPTETERKEVVCSLFGLESDCGNTADRLRDILEMTVGKSYSELVQYCRQAIEDTAPLQGLPDSDTLLRALRERLHMATPASLQSSLIDDFVDMRVMTARELLPRNNSDADYHFPMLGRSASEAWKVLQSSVIIPLCRARELAELQNKLGSRQPRTVVGGVLLAGLPGSGKSEIAMHCARRAASILPTVKLLNVSCTSLIHKELGSSESAIHRLFDAARRAAPCIVLMDGIETVAAVRGNDPTTEGTLDRVLSTLLVELDGVELNADTPAAMVVIGITRNANWIDPALKRPGRLDKVICLEKDWAL